MKLQRKPLFDRLEEGFQAAIAHAEGKQTLRQTWTPAIAPPHNLSAEEILRVRENLELTQETMAQILSVSVGTLTAWESGRRKPSGSLLRLLQVLGEVDKARLWALLRPASNTTGTGQHTRSASS
jgi:putative transcriptional regulator